MIISRGRGYVFVHIPKTGGTSLSLALEARAQKDDILIGDTPKAVRRRDRLKALIPAGRLWKHATLADIEGIVDVREMPALFAFTLVRNPWDRLVSYYHWLRDQTFAHPAVEVARETSFEQFLCTPAIQSSIAAHPYGSYMRTAEGAEHCNAYIRLEHFAQDVAPLEKHLGFTLQLARANSSDRLADYRGYYSTKTAALVGHLCAGDIARFGYTFDPAK